MLQGIQSFNIKGGLCKQQTPRRARKNCLCVPFCWLFQQYPAKWAASLKQLPEE